VQIIEFPDRMDPLLGKVTVAYMADIRLNYDRLRIMKDISFRVYQKLPTLIYRPALLMEEWWRQTKKLLEKGDIGLIIRASDIEYLRKEGIEVDYIALYGSTGFWDLLANKVALYGMSRERFRAIVETFGGHLAALRLFFTSLKTVLLDFFDYKRGKIPRDLLRDEVERLLYRVDVYGTYPIPKDLYYDVTYFMHGVNMAVVIRKLGNDLVKLLELDEPLKLEETVVIEGETAAKDIYEAVKAVHPRAVDNLSGTSFTLRHLF